MTHTLEGAPASQRPEGSTPRWRTDSARWSRRIRSTPCALGHLRHAIELSEQFRDYAVDDPDLDAIRDEAGFGELVGRGS